MGIIEDGGGGVATVERPKLSWVERLRNFFSPRHHEAVILADSVQACLRKLERAGKLPRGDLFVAGEPKPKAVFDWTYRRVEILDYPVVSKAHEKWKEEGRDRYVSVVLRSTPMEEFVGKIHVSRCGGAFGAFADGNSNERMCSDCGHIIRD